MGCGRVSAGRRRGWLRCRCCALCRRWLRRQRVAHLDEDLCALERRDRCFTERSCDTSSHELLQKQGTVQGRRWTARAHRKGRWWPRTHLQKRRRLCRRAVGHEGQTGAAMPDRGQSERLSQQARAQSRSTLAKDMVGVCANMVCVVQGTVARAHGGERRACTIGVYRRAPVCGDNAHKRARFVHAQELPTA